MSANLDFIKEKLVNEWLPASEKERPEIADRICVHLAWELDITTVPYNPYNDDDPAKWRHVTKSESESLVAKKAENENN